MKERILYDLRFLLYLENMEAVMPIGQNWACSNRDYSVLLDWMQELASLGMAADIIKNFSAMKDRMTPILIIQKCVLCDGTIGWYCTRNS